jgi:hypothetical protein
MVDLTELRDWLKIFLDISFPVAVSAYLLFFVFRELRMLVELATQLVLEVRVGLRVILAELDAQDKFNDQLKVEQAKAELAKKESK